MKIKRIIGGSLESNCYIVSIKERGNCFIIDPGYEAKNIIEEVRKAELNPQGIILTHGHHDHIGAAAKVRDYFFCPIMIHSDDSFKLNFAPDKILEDGDTLELDSETFVIQSTPGHTKGSICIVATKSKVIFTGDTVFGDDLGRTDLPGGSEKDMKSTCRNVVDKWSNEFTIYPGHEEKASMKHVRTHNEEFLNHISK